MNTRVLGDIGVAQAVLWFTEHDYIVSVPTTESSPYDLVVQKRGTQELSRVQCKRTTNGTISLRTMGGNQSWGGEVKRVTHQDTDLVWLSYNDSAWLIPSTVLHERATICPGKRVSQYRVLGPDEGGPSAKL